MTADMDRMFIPIETITHRSQYACGECGAVVVEQFIRQHSAWHDGLADVAAQARRSSVFTNVLGASRRGL